MFISSILDSASRCHVIQNNGYWEAGLATHSSMLPPTKVQPTKTSFLPTPNRPSPWKNAASAPKTPYVFSSFADDSRAKKNQENKALN
jgi:hypothetical protein